MKTCENKILIVDDEPTFLSLFRSYMGSKNYSILAAQNEQEVYDILNKEPVAVIFSDQRMPSINGSSLLAKIRVTHPDIVRVLITGYSDLQAVIDSVNQGFIYRYISKSALPQEIVLVASQCLEKYQHDREMKRLAEANQRLLRLLSSQKYLHEMGIFGLELSSKLETMITQLPGYIFKEAGKENHPDLGQKYANLTMSLDKIRRLSELSEKTRFETKENTDLNELIFQELENFKKQAEENKVQIKVEFQKEKKEQLLTIQPGPLHFVLKELLENSVLFGLKPISSVAIKTFLNQNETDPCCCIEIKNKTNREPAETSRLFAPFYTTFTQAFANHETIPSIDDYNFKPYGHFGLGLAFAQWMASKMEAIVELEHDDSGFTARLIIPLA